MTPRPASPRSRYLPRLQTPFARSSSPGPRPMADNTVRTPDNAPAAAVTVSLARQRDVEDGMEMAKRRVRTWKRASTRP
jgi:hypothetical protein